MGRSDDTDRDGFYVDGSRGEGGGQILRSALTVACSQARELRMENIRARRSNPGLAPQHLTAVHAAGEITNADLEGAHLGSTRIRFSPRRMPCAGQYHLDVARRSRGGSAGSVALIAQTLLIPLMRASGESEVVLEGGTHVPHSPPFHYLKHVYGPAMRSMGIGWVPRLEQWGFYPRGGGRIRFRVDGQGPGWTPGSLDRRERGSLRAVEGISAVANLSVSILERQTGETRRGLEEAGFDADIRSVQVSSPGPGTAVVLWARYDSARAGFVSLGRKGKPAEKVAREAVDSFQQFHRSGVPVDRYLADQLVLPLAMSDSKSQYRTSRSTSHLTTHIDLVKRCLGTRVSLDPTDGSRVMVRVEPAGGSSS